ncbi:hypothetical protein C8J56DRAFT_115858 [Mycena floridula]|nr:hypothetical protein C8J56DRAFT_115858 [Mycena floridula]
MKAGMTGEARASFKEAQENYALLQGTRKQNIICLFYLDKLDDLSRIPTTEEKEALQMAHHTEDILADAVDSQELGEMSPPAQEAQPKDVAAGPEMLLPLPADDVSIAVDNQELGEIPPAQEAQLKVSDGFKNFQYMIRTFSSTNKFHRMSPLAQMRCSPHRQIMSPPPVTVENLERFLQCRRHNPRMSPLAQTCFSPHKIGSFKVAIIRPIVGQLFYQLFINC